ncbi:MAG: DUF4142 domain-containing protein [Pseudomonas sp.]|uniref:DUF4142 domain-containing protein n=1 Tax=Pseudomonas sp. TaxID=306 RepID=UPI001D6F8BF8|nr:DUF4142 domain-containing protein [Pseudomonas sp.]MPS98053.1 DUF4142 domain-containing protein [Pseudomonas sp.]
MKQKFLMNTLILGLVLSFGASAQVSKNDQEFMNKAAAGGLYEVEAGRLAQQKASSSSVKAFGDMLVKDHSSANEELKALASAKKAVLPSEFPADKKKRLTKIAGAKDFDKEFVREIGINDHREDIKLFEKASKDADDSQIKDFAAKTLPALVSHRDHAQELQKNLDK